MAVNHRLQSLLVQSRVEYELLQHREAFTAQEVAQTTHVRGRQLAKVVLVRAGRDQYLMAVMPASQHVDLELLAQVSGRKHLELATEGEILRVFSDCEPGAMPPFGNLYDLPIFLDACLAREEHITFQAGNHHEVVRMPFADYERLAGTFAKVACLHRAGATAVV
jgi:Ala-tRNA(Pro) deacylase